MKRFSGMILCYLAAFLGLSGILFTEMRSYAAMNEYCQAPPFVTAAVQPNVMLTVDVSGSMGWCAYNPDRSKSGCCTSSNGCGWTYKGTEEGYFTPNKKYKYNSTNGWWEETTDTTPVTVCPKNPNGISTESTKRYMGSCLNFHLMSRIDLVRWAMTGGNPASCNGSFDPDYCDPELWDQPGNSGKVGSVCNGTIGGCILLTSGGKKVKVPWSRVYDGLVFQFKNMSLRPRMGAMFFSGSGIKSSGKVYIGDFTAPNSTSTQFPYKNLITAINSLGPSGPTPTGPAMWDTFNYFKQTPPQYGGLAVQSGSGDRWRNPMYVCDAGGANCSLIPCAKNFVILMSDGQWNTPSCSTDSDPVVPAYQMHKGFTNVKTNVSTNVNAVYTIGLFLGGTGELSLKNVAMYGAFNTAGRVWPDSLTGYPQGTCRMDDCRNDGSGSGCTNLPASSPDWDANGDGLPDTFYSASDAQGIKDTIMNAILDILRRASSGTAVSVLSSSEGSGANLIQALFYPKRTFGQTEISWISDLMNYWYYMDPFFTYSQIREDTVREGDTASPPYTLLDLKNDYIANFYFDNSQQKTMESRCKDTDGNGSCDTSLTPLQIEDAKAIWRAGISLWQTDPSSRWIKTWTNQGTGLISFSTSSTYLTAIKPYLGVSDDAAARGVINYIKGYDCADSNGNACACGQSGCTAIGRNRTVSIDINKNGTIDTGETNVWKLGDIISSTPRIMGPSPLNNYSLPSPFGYNDQTYYDFINSNDYANRGRVFVGANDGMLHAFRLGKLSQTWFSPTQQQWQKAMLAGGTGTGGIGSEMWAFVPRNVLPYLKYLSDPNYCHFYLVDGPITMVDASINAPASCTQANYWDCPRSTAKSSGNLDLANTSWRTVAIGSMGIGGASIKKFCNGNANGTPCYTDADCNGGQTCQNPDSNRVGAPLLISGNPVGFSSYFALDVTNQDSPQLLWEFSDPALGFTNVGPAIVRVGDRDKNGRWFAVLASGPTGAISNQQFTGVSNQNLKLFIIDMKTGALLRTIDTGIANAFAGSLQDASIDLERNDTDNTGNYSDDVVYVGYTQCTANCGTSAPTWNGGVLRLVINDNPNPNQWTVSKVIDGVGPITSSVAKLLDRKAPGGPKLWLYFGEGRYFYKTDDLTTQRKLYGIQEPCYVNSDIALSCNNAFNKNFLQDQTSSITTSNGELPEGKKGWYINLDAANASYGAERVLSNPTASPSGAVFFVTFAPSSDICGYGGNTSLWAIDYKTGGSVGYAMQGKALIQVSTGEIKELDLSDKTGTFPNRSNRKSNAILGLPPPGQAAMVVTNPQPIRKIMHIQER
ncbi:MAG: pilus assembly protein [Dissulfurimicrobium sp.]|uniref:pilus assembly protein n=1 Tax=Dissulfurimicrobium sp. TaxID=2022436 RepID=UPI00404B0F5D